MISALGSPRAASLISAATQVMYTHPSNANSTEMSATPNPFASGPAPVTGSEAMVRKWLQSPCPNASPSTTSAAMAANFSHVAAFTSLDPRFSPTTFAQVVPAMAATDVSFAGVIASALQPNGIGTDKSACVEPRVGNTAPKYCANPTASAAMVPVCTTANIIHP